MATHKLLVIVPSVTPSTDHPYRSWRERLRAEAPKDYQPLPAWMPFILLIVAAPFLMLASSLAAILVGAFLGLERGVGPEQTGGAIFILLGGLISILLALLVAFVATRRNCSRGFVRYLFLCCSAPAWITALVGLFQVVRAVLSRVW
jgi:hypothetical protein